MSINENIVGLIVCYRDGTRLLYGVAIAANAALVCVNTAGRPVHVPWAAIKRVYPAEFTFLLDNNPSEVSDER